jgi:hypothetical protein
MDNEIHRSLFGTFLHVHHVSYARLGEELDEDLEALCKRCHNVEESSEYDPTEVGDHWAIDLDVAGERRGRLPLWHGMEGDVSGPPETYWARALDRLDARRRQLVSRETEEARKEIGRLDGLETYARACLTLACPEQSSEIAEQVRVHCERRAESLERWPHSEREW